MGFVPMPKVFHPLLLIIANATHRELAAQAQHLKVENESTEASCLSG
jgi:hypothetical protein